MFMRIMKMRIMPFSIFGPVVIMAIGLIFFDFGGLK